MGVSEANGNGGSYNPRYMPRRDEALENPALHTNSDIGGVKAA